MSKDNVKDSHKESLDNAPSSPELAPNNFEKNRK